MFQVGSKILCDSAVKNPPANAGDPGSTPGLGRSPGEGNGNPLQYSYLRNPMVRGTWWATVHEVIKSWTQLSNSTTTTAMNECLIYFKKHESHQRLQRKARGPHCRQDSSHPLALIFRIYPTVTHKWKLIFKESNFKDEAILILTWIVW